MMPYKEITITLSPDEVETLLGALDGEVHEANQNAMTWQGRAREQRYLDDARNATLLRNRIEHMAVVRNNG